MDVTSPAIAATTYGELVSPEGTQEGKEYLSTTNDPTIDYSHQTTLPMVSPEGTQDVKTQGTGPRQLKVKKSHGRV